jgi:hypothetical protein
MAAKPGRLLRVTNTDNRAVLVPRFAGAVLRGGGDERFCCPHCDELLADAVPRDRIWDVVIECFSCHGLAGFPRLPAGSRVQGGVFMPNGRYALDGPIDTKGALLVGEGAVSAATPGGTTWN